jgi:dTMP kinase
MIYVKRKDIPLVTIKKNGIRRKKNKMKHFITFEGIDGSGKSTLSRLVFKTLKNKGYNVIYTYEPTNTYIGKYVKRCIETKTDPYTTTFAFISDRIQHSKKIKKWLSNDKIVICDRYVDSTYAYQSAQMDGLIKNPIKWLKELSKNTIIIPDRTYLFIIEPKDSLARIQKRNKLIPFEKINFLEKVHKTYLSLSKDKRFKIIDATKSINEILDICINDILP